MSKHNHPSHYGGKDNPYEAIKVIEAWGLGFHIGNTIKYLCRAGKKAGEALVEDLQKAEWYLLRFLHRQGASSSDSSESAWKTSMHYDRICDFHQLAGQEVKEKPAIPSLEVRKLRAKLVLEEALELIEALGLEARVPILRADPGVKIRVDDVLFLEHDEALHPLTPDLIKIADGCADLSVVNIGTMIACGIKDLPLLDLVDENNLAKFGPGGYRREDGKWVKPPGHQPPDIAGELKRQGQLHE